MRYGRTILIGLVCGLLCATGCKSKRSSNTEVAAGDSTSEPVEHKTDAPDTAKPDTQPPDRQKPDKRRPDVKLALAQWLTAQNKGNFAAYRAMYAKQFRGVRRSGEKTVPLDYKGWLKDRKRMFRRGMSVDITDVEITWNGDEARAEFTQLFKAGSYEDVGPKRIVFVADASRKLAIISEEMLQSTIIPPASEGGEDGESLDHSTSLAGSFSAPGKRETIALRIYKSPETGDSEEAMEQGFVVTPYRAELALLDAGGRELATMDVGSWEDGWEWGSSWKLEGTIALGKTGQDAVILRYSSYGEGEGLDAKSEQISIVEITDLDQMDTAWTESANEIVAATDGEELSLTLTNSLGFDDNGERTEDTDVTVRYDDGTFVETSDTDADPDYE